MCLKMADFSMTSFFNGPLLRTCLVICILLASRNVSGLIYESLKSPLSSFQHIGNLVSQTFVLRKRWISDGTFLNNLLYFNFGNGRLSRVLVVNRDSNPSLFFPQEWCLSNEFTVTKSFKHKEYLNYEITMKYDI